MTPLHIFGHAGRQSECFLCLFFPPRELIPKCSICGKLISLAGSENGKCLERLLHRFTDRFEVLYANLCALTTGRTTCDSHIYYYIVCQLHPYLRVQQSSTADTPVFFVQSLKGSLHCLLVVCPMSMSSIPWMCCKHLIWHIKISTI